MFFKELPSFEALSKSSEYYPGMDITACVTWIHIVRVATILQRSIECELSKKGLSYDHFIMLILLAAEDTKVPVSKLTEMTYATSATISASIVAMERNNLIRLTTEPTNKNLVYIDLTPEGRKTINNIAPIVFENQSTAMFDLDDDGLRSLFLLLSKINLEV